MDRYAFLLTAMTLEEAKTALGFPPTSAPSPGDIKSAWKTLAFKSHPDRGGDEETMKELNAAKDILLGKARPSYSRSSPGYSSPNYPSSGGEADWGDFQPKEHQYEVVTFEEAKAKSNLPSGVTWKFVTPMQSGRGGWSGDSSSKTSKAFVAYGVKDKQHVFAGASNSYDYSGFVGGGHTIDIWTIEVVQIPMKKDEGKNPAWLYRNVVSTLKKLGLDAKFNSKVMDADGWKFKEKLPKGKGVSIKHWLVNSGEVSADDSSVAGRKQVVELEYHRSYMEKPGFHEVETGYSTDHLKIVLNLNGKSVDLSKGDTQKVVKSRLLTVVYGARLYDGSKKNLTRMRNGKRVMEWLVKNLKDLKDQDVAVLEAAMGQMRG